MAAGKHMKWLINANCFSYISVGYTSAICWRKQKNIRLLLRTRSCARLPCWWTRVRFSPLTPRVGSGCALPTTASTSPPRCRLFPSETSPPPSLPATPGVRPQTVGSRVSALCWPSRSTCGAPCRRADLWKQPIRSVQTSESNQSEACRPLKATNQERADLWKQPIGSVQTSESNQSCMCQCTYEALVIFSGVQNGNFNQFFYRYKYM